MKKIAFIIIGAVVSISAFSQGLATIGGNHPAPVTGKKLQGTVITPAAGKKGVSNVSVTNKQLAVNGTGSTTLIPGKSIKGAEIKVSASKKAGTTVTGKSTLKQANMVQGTLQPGAKITKASSLTDIKR